MGINYIKGSVEQKIEALMNLSNDVTVSFKRTFGI